MTTDVITRDELLQLAERKGPCVSLYMPAHRVSAGMEQDRVRFKNLVRRAGEQLKNNGVRVPAEILQPAISLENDNNFWNYQSDGLAMFLAQDFMAYYRIPIEFKELVFVNDRFHLKPLIPMLSEDGLYYVLALSAKEYRLLECTRHSVKELEPENVPCNIDEANRLIETDKGFTFHSRTMGGATYGHNAIGASYHGQGANPKDEQKDRIHRYFQQIDQGLHRRLMDRQAPLVLAGVDYLLPIYRDANTYIHLVEKGLIGNPQMMRSEELAAEAWPLVEPIFSRSRHQAEEKYMQLLGSHKASNDIKEVVRAAYQGRVGVLMVATDIQQWGVYDLSSDQVEVHPEPQAGDDDLLEYATIHTLRKDGIVYALKPNHMPLETPVAALFRF